MGAKYNPVTISSAWEPNYLWYYNRGVNPLFFLKIHRWYGMVVLGKSLKR